MKPLNENELRELVQWMKPEVEHSRLQDVGVDAHGLWLEIYRQGVLRIYFDLKPGRGFMVLWSGEESAPKKSSQKPLGLFLNSHAKNLELRELRMKKGFGRVVEIFFTSQDGQKTTTLTVVLIPQALNAIAESDGKKLYFEKPKPLEAQDQTADFPVRYTDWEDYLRDYAELRRGPVREGQADPVPASQLVDARLNQWKKDLQKKRGAIQKIDEAVAAMDADAWRAFGEELKFGQALPQHPRWDGKLSLADNRERAFRKAKETKTKLDGNLERRAELIEQISELERWIDDPALAPAPKVAVKGRGTRALQKTETKGRTLNLASGKQAVYGRSAKDNLAILRQARAWDLWMHLKDEPGAHAIIFREKNENVGQNDIEEVAQWLYQESHGKKTRMVGLRFEVIVVECRFVRPIKGDNLGRVNYHSPTVYSFASKD